MERCAGRSVPGGRTCARRRAIRKPCWVLWLLVVATKGAGCSFVYTRGPQPEVQPPPPCTTDNWAPTTDTVIAAVSVAAVVAGAVIYADGMKPCSGFLCQLNEESLGGGAALVAGGVGTLIFTPSAIVGYRRTSDCRAWLEANPQYAPPPAPSPPSSSLLVPSQGCPTSGDVPRVCSAAVPWALSAASERPPATR